MAQSSENEKSTMTSQSKFCKGMAKKGHHICCGKWDKKKEQYQYDFDIKKDQDIFELKIPLIFQSALKTEKVI